MRTFIVQQMDDGVLVQVTDIDGIIDADGMVHLKLQRQVLARLQDFLNEEE